MDRVDEVGGTAAPLRPELPEIARAAATGTVATSALLPMTALVAILGSQDVSDEGLGRENHRFSIGNHVPIAICEDR